MDLFSDDMRRNPFAAYAQLRAFSPVFNAPPPFDMWMVFDYENVKRVVSDFECFSSQVPAPDNWFLFADPPRHTKLRNIISRAFTPKSIAALEPRIAELSAGLLEQQIGRGEMDLAEDYSVPLPMMVIAQMIGIPLKEWPRFRSWSDAILNLSYSMRGMESDAQAGSALQGFRAASAEMSDYLAAMVQSRQASPADDLLTRLIHAEVDGEHLTQSEILGFFQLLIVGGQETTANLINNAIICLLDHPEQLALLRSRPELLAGAIEEVLRFRSPVQWIMRAPTRDAELGGQVVPKGKLVLAMLGSANRDPGAFPNAEVFDIQRNPNPHVSFGHGIHACLGAALARMEARIALGHLLERLDHFELASRDPWPPRQALHVHGPAKLPIRFKAAAVARTARR